LGTIDANGRPESQVLFLKNWLKQNGDVFTRPALVRLEKYLSRNNVTPYPTTFHGEGASEKVVLPSVDDLLSGRIEKFAFARALKDVMNVWFGGSVDRMARETRIPALDLTLYMKGGVLPNDYESVYRIGAAIRHITVEGLANAWIADMHRIALADEEIRDGSPVRDLPYEERRVEMLMYSTALKLGEPYAELQQDHLYYSVATSMYRAMMAGFESATVLETFSDYLATMDGGVKGLERGAQSFEEAKNHILASYLLQIGAHHYARMGRQMKSAVLLKRAADVLEPEVGYNKFAKDYVKRRRIELYEQALMENAKGRADSGLNAGPGVLYQFKVEVVGKLGKLGVEYFENQVFSPLPEALKARPPKATIVVRKKGKSSKSGSGSGSSGGGISIKGVELAHRPKGSEVVLGVDAPGEKRFGGIASAGSAALDSYLSKLNPERRAVVEDFSISSPSVWKVIKGEERTDIVEAAFRAISGGSDASAVSSVVFHSALVKLAYGAGLIDDPSAGKVFKSDPAYTIEAGSTWIFGGQQVPVTKK